MSMKAVKDIYKYAASIAPATYNATVRGAAIGCADVLENKIDIVPGTITDGTHTPSIEDSPDNATWTAVAAANLVGSLGNLATNTPQSVSYIGIQPYIRVSVTVAGATTGGAYSAGAQLRKRKQP